MKHFTTSRAWGRLSLLLLTLMAVLLTVTVPVAAADVTSFSIAPETDAHYATFSVDSSGSIVAHFPANDALDEACTRTYTVSPLTTTRFLNTLPSGAATVYENGITVDGTAYEVWSNTYAGDYLLLKNGEYGLVYFTEEGIRKTLALPGQSSYLDYVLRVSPSGESLQYKEMSATFAATLADLAQSGGEGMSIPLSQLRYATGYELIGYGADNTWVGVTVGMIYYLDGDYCYLDLRAHPALSSTPAGAVDFAATPDETVTLYPLDADSTATMESAIATATGSVDTTYEYDLAPTDPAVTMVVSVFCGILVPAAPVAVGLGNAFSKRTQGRRRWLLLAALGGVWCLCGVFITVLLALA